MEAQDLNKFIHYIEVTDSTNRLLTKISNYKSLNNSNLEDFFTIYAGTQTSGRGLAQNQWESAPNENLLCSIHFCPSLIPRQQFAFNQCFTLAVRQTIKQFVRNVQIKWPNDLYVDDKKIAGILIEHTISGNKITRTIAGLGLNVNQIQFSKRIPNPTSLRINTQCFHDVAQILEILLQNLQQYYERLKNGEFSLLQDEYLQNLYKLNQISQYEIQGQIIDAKIVGVNDIGQLQLEICSTGERMECDLKSVKYIL
ncbi:MAG: biotin--[acetyl-CoA-carboxylase] ligase [Bacteroidales bacterium]|nr:biotin--[acetyl-CoA-carboxylase] ligase [Bacteroidales bacterium]